MKLYQGINKKHDRFREDFFNENSYLAGYSAIIEFFKLKVPQPYSLSLISDSKKAISSLKWKIYRERYLPEDNIFGHIQFALKYEGINLLVFKKLFEVLPIAEVKGIINYKKTGQYSRKIWFLYEWIMDKKLSIVDLEAKVSYVPVVNTKLQFALENGIKNKRQMIVNNLLGVKGFSPWVNKNEKILAHLENKYNEKIKESIAGLTTDILHRAAAYITLKDCQSSFFIEGESPPQNRSQRWAKAIGQAGKKELSEKGLQRLQAIILGDDQRFIEFGYRSKGGWIGERNRITNHPIPEHISARSTDLELIMNNWLAASKKMISSEMDAVIVAGLLGFGFVFIHPFEDGNGRLHRFLFHHVLARMKYNPQGMIFPLSFAILENIDQYKSTLKEYSEPLLPYIKYKVTQDLNVEVTNDTEDYYSYWDATAQIEFLFDCVEKTVKDIIPQEIKYIQNYEEFKKMLNEKFAMPDQKITLLNNFLFQNGGKLAKRKREKEFQALTDAEVKLIEGMYKEIFAS